MDKTQPQTPEPLNYLTALSSMKAIRRILNDQAGWYSNILWIHIEAPFSLLDFHSFKKSIHDARPHDQIITNELKILQEWAAGNIKLCDEIEAKNQQGTDERYYCIKPNGDTFPVNTEKGISEFGRVYKEQRNITKGHFYKFCRDVKDLTDDWLKIPANPPEPLTLSTALSSMKAINMIFQNQRASLYQFDPVRISSPFLLTDLKSFKDDVHTAIRANDILIQNDLKAIGEMAANNIQLFGKISERKYEDRKDKHYTVNKDGIALPVFTTDDSRVPNEDYPQVHQFPLSALHRFCIQVQKFTTDCLAYPMEAKGMTQIISARQLNQPQQPMVQEEPTNPVKALFCFFLIQFEGVPKPKKKDFPNFIERYNFKYTSMDIYNLYYPLFNKKPSNNTGIKNIKNLKAVVNLLIPYPKAFKAAEFELAMLKNASR